MPHCDGRARNPGFGKATKCVTAKQVKKLPEAMVKGLIKYRAKIKAKHNKK